MVARACGVSLLTASLSENQRARSLRARMREKVLGTEERDCTKEWSGGWQSG